MRLACSGLFSWVENGNSVITPSRLLAATAYQSLVRDFLAKGESSWQRPDVLTTGAWLTRCWQEARYKLPAIPALLSPAQEHVLWKRIIEESGKVFDPDAIAATASRATRTLVEWEMPASGPHWSERGDTSQFQGWLAKFRAICHEKQWLTHAEIWQQLPIWLEQRNIAPDKNIFLTSGRLLPVLQAMIARLNGGTSAYSLDASKTGSALGRSYGDLHEQLDFAARYARSLLESDRWGSVGVFVPNLREHAETVERIFRRVFYPGACQYLLDVRMRSPLSRDAAFQLNGIDFLAAKPVISSALLLLRLAMPRIPIADATAIVRSRWIAGAEKERNDRAQADLELRNRRELDVTLIDLESASARCPRLLKAWRAVRRSVQRADRTTTYGGWSKFIGDLLQSLEWPGDVQLSVAEQDAIESWKAAMSQLSTLSIVAGEVKFEAALGELRRLLEDSQEQAGLWAPVQVLDARDCTGLRFDAGIIVGMDEDSWPPKEYRSPFLPAKLLRGHGHNSRSDQARLTKSLYATAPQLFVTWSGRLSPLAAAFVSQEESHQDIWRSKSTWQTFKPTVLEESDDSQGPAFVSDAAARGGTSIIKAQSLCPFRAFAEFRLQSKAPEEGCLGLDSRERGGHLHDLLEFVWQRLKTREKLLTSSPLFLHNLVEEGARQAVESHGGSPFSQIVAAVEVERLKEVVLEWLEVEKKRQQPFTVETVEEERHFELAGLRLRLRLDRIDRLSNGQLLLIDYKSGVQTALKLEGKRPEEPQLLVYAASLDEDVAGVFFAQVKPRDLRLKGISQQRHVAGQGNLVKKEWDAFLLAGKASVHELAAQFKAGNAGVDPLPYACDFCSQKPLCRIHEQASAEEDE